MIAASSGAPAAGAGARRVVMIVRVAGTADIHLPALLEDSQLGALRLLLAPYSSIPVHRMQFRRCNGSGPLIPGSVLTDLKQSLKGLGGCVCVIDADEPLSSFEEIGSQEKPLSWGAMNDVSRSMW